MTRFLSESLHAPEPAFAMRLAQLERANGNPNHDIRLTTEVAHRTRSKIAELGLDPHDTTPKELYQALASRLKSDDARLTKLLRTRAALFVSAEADPIAGLALILRESQQGKQTFALKPSRLKAILKKSAPKRTMKQLGYRSVDSLLRHEAPALILTVAGFVESKSWWHDLSMQYKHLNSRDFEMRPLTILQPYSSRWRAIARSVVAHQKHNVYAFKELGAIILLPLPQDAPVGSVMTSLLLALQSLDQIRSASSYLQLTQVRPDFGSLVASIVSGEPELQAHLFDHAVPWQLIQRSLRALPEALHHELFDTSLQLPENAWRSLGHALAGIEPSLRFWHGTEHSGLLHQGRAVSMHALDVALNVCNQVPFQNRIVHHFQQSLWHELLLRYLEPQAIEQTLQTALQPQLATALVSH